MLGSWVHNWCFSLIDHPEVFPSPEWRGREVRWGTSAWPSGDVCLRPASRELCFWEEPQCLSVKSILHCSACSFPPGDKPWAERWNQVEPRLFCLGFCLIVLVKICSFLKSQDKIWNRKPGFKANITSRTDCDIAIEGVESHDVILWSPALKLYYRLLIMFCCLDYTVWQSYPLSEELDNTHTYLVFVPLEDLHPHFQEETVSLLCIMTIDVFVE